LSVGVLIQERIHVLAGFRTGRSELPGSQGARKRERGRRAPAEADVRGDLALLEQRDIVDECCFPRFFVIALPWSSVKHHRPDPTMRGPAGGVEAGAERGRWIRRAARPGDDRGRGGRRRRWPDGSR
jgi:hypothetical protein